MNAEEIDLLKNWDPSKISEIPVYPLSNDKLSATSLHLPNTEIIFTGYRDVTLFA